MWLLFVCASHVVDSYFADEWTKEAASESGYPCWVANPAVLYRPCGNDKWHNKGYSGSPENPEGTWWYRWHQSQSRAQHWLECLYQAKVPVHWPVCTRFLCMPCVQDDAFVHPVAPAVNKRMARIRAGGLAWPARLVCHGPESGTPGCLCCGAVLEDNEHILPR